MKNIILGVIGIFITIYTLLIGLNILTVQSHKNQLEKHLSRIVKNVLESAYQTGEKETVKQMLLEEISDSISTTNEVSVEIREIDLQKGILSVKVIDQITTITGAKKEIVMEKTAIMDKIATNLEMVTVTFWVEEEVYKEYQIVKGYKCPMPKSPSDLSQAGKFIGWKEFGTEKIIDTEQLNEIWENRVYVAVFE